MSNEKIKNINDEHNFKKEDDDMTTLAQYLATNREQAYASATQNTKYNEQGHPVIPLDDEWISESEWDELFTLLSNKKAGKEVNE